MSSDRTRTCIACRSKRSKELFLRLVLDDQGLVLLDKKQGLPGRGAYVCPSELCVAMALKGGRLDKAFKRPCKVDFGSTQVEVMTGCRK